MQLYEPTITTPEEVLNISSSGLLRERIRNVRQRLLCFLVIGDLLGVLLAVAIGFSLKIYSPLGVLGHNIWHSSDWYGLRLDNCLC